MSHETDPLTIDIPDTLRPLDMWFAWRWANQPDGGRFKLPVQPSGKPASSTGKETWHPYEKAARAVNNFEGLAIGLGHITDDISVWGIDLDGAAGPNGIKPWALKIIARLDSYTEFSPSGKGVHILVLGDREMLPAVKINLSETEHIEAYSHSRYFTFSGNHMSGTPLDLKPREAVYKALRAELDAMRPSSQRSRAAQRARKPATAGRGAQQSVGLTDAELLDKAQSGPSGDAFKRLYSGDMEDYRNDHSSADMALAGRLAFWTGRDPEQIDRLFRESGLMRDKWDTRRGLSTYGEQTIEIAIDNCEDVYSGGDKASESFVEKLKAKRAAKVAETQKVGATVVAGRVREHERGDDKPAHGKKFDPVGASAPVVATPAHEGREHGGIPPAPSRVEAPTAKPPITGMERIPSSYVDEDGVRRSGLTGRAIEEPRTLWPGTYDPKLPQADLFTGNGMLHEPVNGADSVNIAEQHGDGAHVSIHPKETVPLPVLPAEPMTKEEAEEERKKRPSIQATKRPLEVVTKDALDALKESNIPPRIFLRSGLVVRIGEDEKDRPTVTTLNTDSMRGEFARSANYFTISEKGVIYAVDPPYNVVRDALSIADYDDRFPPLEGVIEAPVLRADGSVQWQFGYDPATLMYYHPSGLIMPGVPDEPTTEDVARSVAIIEDIIGEFPFDSEASHANAIAMFLTPIVRPYVRGQAPLGLLDAPQQGTGKSLLATVNSIVATGQEAGAFTAPVEEAEWRKSITAMVRAGYSYILIDNLDLKDFRQQSMPLHSSALSAVLTTGFHRDRILGHSEPITILTKATWFASGNNIQVSGDLIRRVYRTRMDAGVSRPWQRKGFKHPQLIEHTHERRAQILWALLTMARAWVVAGAPIAPTPPLGSFESWSRTIGGILHFAGIEGFLGELETLYEEADSDTPEWEAFLSVWREKFGPQWIKAAELARAIIDDRDGALRGVLPGYLTESLGSTGFTKRLGNQLQNKKGMRHGKAAFYLVTRKDTHSKVAEFRVLVKDDPVGEEVAA